MVIRFAVGAVGQVMWKHLDEASFPLSEEEYMDQLDAVVCEGGGGRRGGRGESHGRG